MKQKKVIQNTETGLYLRAINLMGGNSGLRPLAWSSFTRHAIQLENDEEAHATITFIGSVIDWELEEHLKIVAVEVSNG